jgi:hypothetical protein
MILRLFATAVVGFLLTEASIGPGHAQAVNCADMLAESRAVAHDIEVLAPSTAGLRAGEQFKLRWKEKVVGRRANLRLPIYIVIAAPAASRLSGQGFLALAPGAVGPDGIVTAKAAVRAFIPLHRVKAASGELGISSYTAGANKLSWTIASGGVCGQQIYNSQGFTLQIAPGAPSVVLQEAFSVDQPLQRLRSRDGQYDLLIFRGRYEVRNVATGARIVERAGLDPNFSPTGRFVAARKEENQFFEVIDLVSGSMIDTFPSGVLAWARADSFVINGFDAWGGVSIRQTVVDRATSTTSGQIIGCHACSAWNDTQMLLDVDHGYFAAGGGFQGVIFDLMTDARVKTRDWNGADSRLLARRELEDLIRRQFSPGLAAFAKNWSLGEALALSHVQADPVQKKFLVASNDVSAAAVASSSQAATQQLVGTEYVGRGARSEQTSEIRRSDPAFSFDLLAQAGIKTLSPAAKTFELVSTDAAVWSATRGLILNDIRKRVPEASALLMTNKEICPTEGDGKFVIDTMSQIKQWDSPHGRSWLLQGVCLAGSAGMVNYAELFLITEEHGGARARSVLSLLDSKLRSDRQLDRNNYAIFPYEDGYVFVASRIGPSAVLINGKANRREGSYLPIFQPELLLEMRRLADGKHVVQLNHDNQFYVFRLSDGKKVFGGVISDGEVVVVTDDGLFDTTYEGATSVQIRFPGIAGLYTFHQFDSLLRRKDLARRMLAGEQVDPRPDNLRSPPRIHLTLAAIGKDGLRTGQVSVASDQGLAQLRYYIDGLLIKTVPVSGAQADLPVELADPGAGRWISTVAIDGTGLVSLPSTVRIPGNPAPAGVLRGVLVGIDDYDDASLSKLNSAQLDARNLTAALAKGARGFQQTETQMLLNREATPQAIISAVRAAALKTTVKDTLLVFFAGHGLDGGPHKQPDASLVLATSGTRLDSLQGTSMSWTKLASALAEAKGKIIVILDACHSGIAGSETVVSNDAIVDSLVSRSGAPMIILASSKARQTSGEDRNGGYFTSAMVAALTSERDAADRNKSGLLDVGELYQAVKSRVGRQSEQKQTPWMARNALVGEISLF